MFDLRPEHLIRQVDPAELLDKWAGMERMGKYRDLLQKSFTPGDELWQWSFGAYSGLVLVRNHAIAEIITAVHALCESISVLKVHLPDQLTVLQIATIRRHMNKLRDLPVVELRERLRSVQVLEINEYETEHDLAEIDKVMRLAGLRTELIPRES